MHASFITNSTGPLRMDVADTLYRISADPSSTTMEDVLKVFFNHGTSDAAEYAFEHAQIEDRLAVSRADRDRMDMQQAMHRRPEDMR